MCKSCISNFSGYSTKEPLFCHSYLAYVCKQQTTQGVASSTVFQMHFALWQLADWLPPRFISEIEITKVFVPTPNSTTNPNPDLKPNSNPNHNPNPNQTPTPNSNPNPNSNPKSKFNPNPKSIPS